MPARTPPTPSHWTTPACVRCLQRPRLAQVTAQPAFHAAAGQASLGRQHRVPVGERGGACECAGAAGALLAQTTAYVSLEVLEFNRSADVMLALTIGGTGWLYGGIAGAVVFKILQDTLASSSPQFWMFWLGLFLVALAVVGRDRLSAMVLRTVRR